MKSEELLTMNQAAEVLKTTRPTLYRWLRSGRVSGHKVGRQWRFKPSELERFLTGHSTIDLPADPSPLLEALREAVEEPGPALGDPLKEIFILMLRVAVVRGAESLDLGSYLVDGAPERACWLRYRVDGVLQPFVEIDGRLQSHIVSYWKSMAACHVQETTLPQDGRIVLSANSDGPSRMLDVTVSFLPTMGSEVMTARILDSTRSRQKVSELDLPDSDRNQLLRALNQRARAVIVSAPAGASKSPLFGACLRELAGPTCNLYTIQEPSGQFIPWSNQMSLWMGGRRFEHATIIKSVLRSSPDVIGVAQVPDQASMTALREVTLKGPLVVAGLHADGFLATLRRLLELAGSSSCLAQVVDLLCCQRLIRRNCSHCQQPSEIDPTLRERLLEIASAGGLSYSAIRSSFRHGTGCRHCGQSGYRGQILLVESVRLTPQIQGLLDKSAADEELLAAALGQGMTTFSARAIELAGQGHTALAELERLGVFN